MIPIDILPVFKSPAVQVLTFYGGMPAASVEKDITNRMERWVGQANGTSRQESRSIVGASIVRDYFRSDVDPNGALTQVNSLALAAVPNLPPGTLPPVVLPFDPTSTTPVCIVAVDSPDGSQNESILYDVGRYEVRNMIMSINGAVAPVVYGGKIRAVMAYLDRQKLQARGLSPLDVMNAMDNYNVFLPDRRRQDRRHRLRPRLELDVRLRRGDGRHPAPHRDGNVVVPARRGDAQGRRVHPDQHRAGRRQAARSTSRSSASSAPARWRSSTASEGHARRVHGAADAQRDRPEAGDGPVDLRPPVDLEPGPGGVLGAVLCSLTILLFLGQWRMTAIAVMTLPISVLSACIFLYCTGNTINVMTLAGLTLAIGPMVDSAIICLENTHRHLGMGATPDGGGLPRGQRGGDARAGLDPLHLPGARPAGPDAGHGRVPVLADGLAVAFAMCSAYILSRTLVPACSAATG